ncbi:hypothetical protein HPP92_023096 [Vanilla planifolia]|uniref:Uncharacterized protein n=1 Tax=Vanilla planifolia TaxID=51239 RepID=A0A835PQV1_VANPL|nr:hypothetical protein HPP92_023096 [Vanilla planifolia]
MQSRKDKWTGSHVVAVLRLELLVKPFNELGRLVVHLLARQPIGSLIHGIVRNPDSKRREEERALRSVSSFKVTSRAAGTPGARFMLGRRRGSSS